MTEDYSPVAAARRRCRESFNEALSTIMSMSPEPISPVPMAWIVSNPFASAAVRAVDATLTFYFRAAQCWERRDLSGHARMEGKLAKIREWVDAEATPQQRDQYWALMVATLGDGPATALAGRLLNLRHRN